MFNMVYYCLPVDLLLAMTITIAITITVTTTVTHTTLLQPPTKPGSQHDDCNNRVPLGDHSVCG